MGCLLFGLGRYLPFVLILELVCYVVSDLVLICCLLLGFCVCFTCLFVLRVMLVYWLVLFCLGLLLSVGCLLVTLLFV